MLCMYSLQNVMYPAVLIAQIVGFYLDDVLGYVLNKCLLSRIIYYIIFSYPWYIAQLTLEFS
jgi:hypothetical protein